MTTTQQRQQDDKEEKREQESIIAHIGDCVIQALGKPDDLLKVQVRRLWDSHYRVNILVGADASTPKFANSFFLQTDPAGNIITASPQIKRQYQRSPGQAASLSRS